MTKFLFYFVKMFIYCGEGVTKKESILSTFDPDPNRVYILQCIEDLQKTCLNLSIEWKEKNLKRQFVDVARIGVNIFFSFVRRSKFRSKSKRYS